MAISAPAFTGGHNAQAFAIALDGANSYVQLPANIAKANAFTFAGWVYWNGGADWQRLFDFGNDTSHYLYLTPNSGSGTLRFAINNGNGEQMVERSGALACNSWQHVAITLMATMPSFTSTARKSRIHQLLHCTVGIQSHKKLSGQEPVYRRPVVQRQIG